MGETAMRRTAILIAFFGMLHGNAFGQTRTEARTGSGPDVTMPRYRAVMRDGRIFFVTDYTVVSYAD
jgi:hypothetical protein